MNNANKVKNNVNQNQLIRHKIKNWNLIENNSIAITILLGA